MTRFIENKTQWKRCCKPETNYHKHQNTKTDGTGLVRKHPDSTTRQRVFASITGIVKPEAHIFKQRLHAAGM